MRDGLTLVTLVGEIDVASVPLLDDLLQEAIAVGAPALVVDMALVSFCDAAGLGQLVGAANALREAGAQLSVRAAPYELRRLFHITGLTDTLHVGAATTAEGSLSVDLAAAARLPLTRAVLDAALKLVAVMAQSVMRGADGVSITLPREGRLLTVAASNDVVLQMDHDQYDTGQGPCLDAATHGEGFHSPSLEAERRWPQFVPRARSRGIESIMSTPMLAADRPLGALNVYSRAPDALAAHEQQWAIQFAQEASNVLLVTDATATAASLDGEISDALHARESIALAQGLVMARQQLSPDAAHRFLIDISRRTSMPLLGVCQAVVASASPQGPRHPQPRTAPAGIGMTPASRSLDRARQDAGLSQHDLWVRYFGLGGMTPALELEAVCHGAMIATDPDHDRIAHALNERFTELGRNHPVPYSEDSGDNP